MNWTLLKNIQQILALAVVMGILLMFELTELTNGVLLLMTFVLLSCLFVSFR